MRQKLIIFNTILFIFSLILNAKAQETSKSKSASKLYERGNKTILVNNASRINTKGLDSSPIFYNNGLIFVGEKKNGPIDRKTGTRYFDLFYSEIDKNGIPLPPDRFSQFINGPYNESAACFNNNQDVIYFTSNNQQNGIAKSNKKSAVVLKIYQAQRGTDDWINVQELPFCSDDFNTAHPSLSADGTKLYFSSDRPGGYGGMDLYFSEKIGERWSAPKNLGPKVNTTGKELFPYVYGNDILFFSSSGFSGPGNLDVLFTDLTDLANFDPVLLEEPINSPKDDVGFILESNGQRGYFASNREGGNGSDDIYSFEVQNNTLINKLNQNLELIVTVVDDASGKILPSTAFYMQQADKDGSVNNEDFYNVELVKDNKNSTQIQLSRKKTFDFGEPEGFTNEEGQINLKLEPNQNYIFFLNQQGYNLKEHFYSTSSITGSQNIKVALKLKDCASVTGLVTNQKTGNAVPFADVKITKSCTGEIIPVKADGDGKFEMCLPQGCIATFRAEKEGYIQGLVNLTNPKGNLMPLNAEIKLLPFNNTPVGKIESEGAGKISKGSIIILENIYYDFNKAFIRAGAAKELDALYILMMQYPSMRIELVSHTDSRGEKQYNLELSTQRAIAAKNYLIAKGIDENRIIAAGMGEIQPRNKCKDGIDCTEEEHQFNRRAEVKILNLDVPIDIRYGNKGPEVVDPKKFK